MPAWNLDGRALAASTSPSEQGVVSPEAAGQNDLRAAQDVERAQRAALEAAPVELAYQDALAIYVHAAHAQVGQIEDRLEALIDQQQARLQQTQTRHPSIFAGSATRRAWLNIQAQQQARLVVLNNRLELVREIKDGMGLYGPNVVELATRKLRIERPDLVADWTATQERLRRHHAQMRMDARQQAQERPRSAAATLGLSQQPG